VVGRTGAANIELRFATQGNPIKSSYLAHRLRESNLTEACLTFIGEVKSSWVLTLPDKAYREVILTRQDDSSTSRNRGAYDMHAIRDRALIPSWTSYVET
jgi:hypothetical protein